jgi:RecA/RadA recombinase
VPKKASKISSYDGVPSLSEYTFNAVDLFISTTILPLDYLITGSACGGIPAGRITTIKGEESAGKSTLLAHIFKSCQDLGIACVLCDAENTFDMGFAARVGMDTARLGMLLDKKS